MGCKFCATSSKAFFAPILEKYFPMFSSSTFIVSLHTFIFLSSRIYFVLRLFFRCLLMVLIPIIEWSNFTPIHFKGYFFTITKFLYAFVSISIFSILFQWLNFSYINTKNGIIIIIDVLNYNIVLYFSIFRARSHNFVFQNFLGYSYVYFFRWIFESSYLFLWKISIFSGIIYF